MAPPSPRQLGYLRDEFHSLTLQGTVQRNPLYAPDALEADRKRFRLGLRQALDDMAEGYGDAVTDEQHFEAIEVLARRMSHEHGHVLREGRFHIGHAQKALNLFLKYLWCAGWIPIPPHCPFDRMVIQRLPSEVPLNWTTIDDLGEYRQLVDAARQVAGDQPLAEWELELYSAIR